jgi:hypothetical protein
MTFNRSMKIADGTQKPISPAEALEILTAHEVAGNHVDKRLFRELDAHGELCLFKINTKQDFLSLVWQSNDDCRPLAPTGKSRTLHDCALRLKQHGWAFRNLVDAGYLWFEKCISIDEAFDLSRFNWIALTPLTNGESQESPNGTYYIYDGVHKTIVLAKKLIHDELTYTPITGLLLTPRRK